MEPADHPLSHSSPAPLADRGALQEGRLLGLLVAACYSLFTLLPDSNSLMVSWPWVLVWQISLACPILWLLWQLWYQRRLQGLGHGLDLVTLLGLVGLLVSSMTAEFLNQARWYSWAALGFVAALYALKAWLRTPTRRLGVLTFQGYLSLTFIGVSLLLWSAQTFWPEMVRLERLRQLGLNRSYDFSVLELRNWAPLGHQNYVAGYLLLALPLLGALAILQPGKRRWLWLGGIGLGLLDLYTTNSRGGGLGLLVLAIAALLFWLLFRSSSRWWVVLAALPLLGGFILLNNRLLASLQSLLAGRTDFGELSYRLITNTIGWEMGKAHLWTGAGLGAVPLMFQRYRPGWAGREAELAYQLHSTPAQLWAELGVWGILAPLVLFLLLAYLGVRWLRTLDQKAAAITPSDRVFTPAIYTALLAYAVFSLTDFQLDNIAISGLLVVYLAFLAAHFSETLVKPEQGQRHLWVHILGWGGLGFLVAAGLWLAPIHQAWNLSAQGFTALAPGRPDRPPDFDLFTRRLSAARDLAPWQPYYPYQMGWNLASQWGTTTEPEQRKIFLDNAIFRFEQGNSVSPYQEFGQSNLGWLLLAKNPQTAARSFSHAAQLMPAKRGVFYGLGLSLLAQGKTELAIAALSLEVLRDPLFITSPLWNSSLLRPLYQPVLKKVGDRYQTLLQQNAQPDLLNPLLHQTWGSILWWQGDLTGAKREWAIATTPLNQAILQLAETGSVKPESLQNQVTAPFLLVQAWLNPSQRQQFLERAWLNATETPLPPEIRQQLLNGMAQATSFDQWVKQYAPVRESRRKRAGFGVLSRHIDGPAPEDFQVVVENVIVSTWLADLFPSPFYQPSLDRALQPWRDELVTSVAMLKK
uniref:O-antigen polymerase n=1 Tax=Cyanothece sp. (strain PCC 7425 / ATCC 29141) TaxID=395961 RepID=B8HVJ1_CYAP4